MKKKKIRKFTYNEVSQLLCDCCRLGVPDIWTLLYSETKIHHVVGGTRIECQASKWRLLKENKDKN